MASRRGRWQGRWLVVAALGLVALALCTAALAAGGQLDQSFSGDGKRVTSFSDDAGVFGDAANGVAIQPDGRIVVAGKSAQSGTGLDFALARHRPDGGLDQSFSGNGKQVTSFGSGSGIDEGRAVAIQRNGRIVVAGISVQDDTGADFALARYRPNGGLDQSLSGDGRRVASFANGGGSDLGNALAIQANGRIVVAGVSDQPGMGDDFALARFRANGSLDLSFSGDGKRVISFANASAGDRAFGVAVQSDGRIVVAGYSAQGATGFDFALARLRTNGNLDPSFSGDGRRTTSFGNGAGTDQAFDIAIQPNGRIVVAGVSEQPGTGDDIAVARFRPNGGLDQSFSQDGKRLTSFENGGTVDAGNAVAVQGNGRIVVAGSSDQFGAGENFAVVRFLPSGSLDPSFSGDGKRVTSFGPSGDSEAGRDVAIQRDGRIVVVGSAVSGGGTGDDFGIVRYLAG